MCSHENYISGNAFASTCHPSEYPQRVTYGEFLVTLPCDDALRVQELKAFILI